MTESWKRSTVKTVSWRITATAATVAIVYALTGSATLSLGIGSLELVLRMALYYAHERVWLQTWWRRRFRFRKQVTIKTIESPVRPVRLGSQVANRS